MFAKTAIAALFAAIAAAQVHKPVGENPTPGYNPITKPLNEVVTAGKPFQITWEATSANPVSILLLKGPSTNVVPVQTIAEGIANSGSFEFEFPSTFGSSADATGFGIQIIDDVDGKYQYSTQFGIEVPEGSKGDDKPSSSKDTGYPTKSASSSYVVPSETPSESSTTCESTVEASSTAIVYPTAPAPSAPAPTGTGYQNGTVIQPSKSMTVPSSLKTSATGSATSPALPESTGAASGLRAGLGLAVGVAGLVFVL